MIQYLACKTQDMMPVGTIGPKEIADEPHGLVPVRASIALLHY